MLKAFQQVKSLNNKLHTKSNISKSNLNSLLLVQKCKMSGVNDTSNLLIFIIT